MNRIAVIILLLFALEFEAPTEEKVNFPEIFSQDKHSELFTIASFSTSVADQDSNVKMNIALACEKLDNYTIARNSNFSFNSVVGEGSSANGFVVGRVLYHDMVRYEPGGGLCQVSSSLFNALLLSGCSIIERHRHYQPVTYVPLGLDATIKFGKKDLRMKNPYDHDLIIRTGMNEKSLVVTIHSPRPLDYRYDIITEEEEVPVPLVDAENIRQGISVYVYRQKFIKDKLMSSFLLYKDYYPPVRIN